MCGLKPTSPGWKTFTVKPYFPQKLLSAHARVETPMGSIVVKWLKQYGKTQLYVTVPFGTAATVTLPDGTIKEISSGRNKLQCIL